MKSTLAMSDYGTLSDNTRFIIFSGDKATYQFKYKNNSISQEEVKIDTLTDEIDYDTIIIHGTTGTNDVTTVTDTDWSNVKAVLKLTANTATLTAPAAGKDYYTVLKEAGSAAEDAVYSLYAGEFDDSKTYYTRTGTSPNYVYTQETVTSANFSDFTELYVITTPYKPATPAVYYKIFINTDYPKDLITVTTSNN